MAQWIRTPPPPEEPEEEQEPKASRRKRRKRGDRAPVKAPPEEPRHNIRASLPWRPDTAGSAGSKFRSILIGPSPPEASPKNLHSDVTRESVYLDDLCARLAHVTRKHGLDRIRDLPQHSTMCENLPIASLEIRNKLIKSHLQQGHKVGYRSSGWSCWPAISSNDLCYYTPVKKQLRCCELACLMLPRISTSPPGSPPQHHAHACSTISFRWP